MRCRGVVVITTAQLNSTKSELRFCAVSNPAHSVSVPAGNKVKHFSSVNYTTKTIHDQDHFQPKKLFNFFKNAAELFE